MKLNEKLPVKVLVVDDHPLTCKGIALCLARHGDMQILGEIGDPREVLNLARALRPDVILMDISMPHLNGLELTRRLQQALPASKVLMLSIHEDPDYVRQAIQAGARGYVLKGGPVAELINAVETVQRGEFYFSGNMVRLTLAHFGHGELNHGPSRLTDREQEVLVQVAEGRSNKEIAGELGVSVRTVEFHREHLKHKLHIHSAAGLARFAVAQGWVPAEMGASAPGHLSGRGFEEVTREE